MVRAPAAPRHPTCRSPRRWSSSAVALACGRRTTCCASAPRPTCSCSRPTTSVSGASGRNGGWVSALWPVSPDTLARHAGRARAWRSGRAATPSTRSAASTEPRLRQRVHQGRCAGRRAHHRPGGARAGGGRPRGRVGRVDDVAGCRCHPRAPRRRPHGGPPSPPTAPGCTRGGSSTGWRGPCSQARWADRGGGTRDFLRATGSWCSPTDGGCQRVRSSTRPRAGRGRCRGRAAGSFRCTR